MIGLAAVILLIAIAGAILGSVSRGGGDAVAVARSDNLAIANDDDQATEPLSDLGVVPSAGNDQAAVQP